jgi:HAE1 family hydrophobic/amphiphilic exporter-1
MQKLSELCVRRPVLAWVLILIPLVVGITGFLQLGVDRFPQVDLPTVSVSASLPGAAPETIETTVAEPIEEAVNTVSGIEDLRSTSSEGSASVRITFNLSTDIDVATQEVRDRLARIQRSLPEDMDPPTVRRFDPNQTPVMAIVVSGNRPIRDLTEYADKTLSRQIESAYGVGDVQLRGDRDRQINIYLDAYKMRAFNVTTPDVITALQQQNIEVPGGLLEQPKQTLTLRTLGRIQSPREFNSILLRAGGGQQVRLQDVARVEDGLAEELTSAEFNGKRAVQLSVYKQSGLNTLDVIQDVRTRLEKMAPTVPKGIELHVVRSQDDFIRASVDSVEEHLIVGSILASLVVLLFLWNWRSTLVAALAIPTSIISTFAVMWIMGFTLNVITLLALTLAVGIVIDDAIVVLENIYRFMEEKGLSPIEAAIEGTREIGFAVMSTTLSLVAVFLPVAFMSGIVGRFLASFGLTMSFAILVSLFVSFTLTPMLTAHWLKRKWNGSNGNAAKENAAEGAAENDAFKTSTHAKPETRDPKTQTHTSSKQRGFYSFIDETYAEMLEWSLHHRWVVVLVCVGTLACIPILWKMLPFNFLPEEDESQFQVSLKLPLGTSLAVTRDVTQQVDAVIRSHKEAVDYTLMNAGGSIYGGVGDFNEASIYVGLKPLGERTEAQEDVIEKLRRQLNGKFRSANVKVRVSPINSLNLIGGGGAGRIQYILSGPDLNVLREASEKAVTLIEKIPGVADADSNLQLGQPELDVQIDRNLAGELGVNPSQLATALRYLVGGDNVSTYIEGGEQYDVYLRADPQYRADVTGLSLLTVPASPDNSMSASSSQAGGQAAAGASAPDAVTIDQLVHFKRVSGPAEINRYNRRRQITLTANVEQGASEAAIGAAIEQVVYNLNLGPQYQITATGASREQKRTNAAFMLALGMSLVFMYLILAAQFESWIHPVTILLSLPLTVPFALLSLFLFNQSLNVFSLLGVLVLFGVVKKNAILQIDHTNQLREAGINRHDAIITANRDRLRPILMTTLAFVAGMLPLVLSRGSGSGTNHAIGTVIFGGQTLSLLLTLLAVPVAYSLFDDLTQYLARRHSQE